MPLLVLFTQWSCDLRCNIFTVTVTPWRAVLNYAYEPSLSRGWENLLTKWAAISFWSTVQYGVTMPRNQQCNTTWLLYGEFKGLAWTTGLNCLHPWRVHPTQVPVRLHSKAVAVTSQSTKYEPTLFTETRLHPLGPQMPTGRRHTQLQRITAFASHVPV
jgi:hypothetical protein